MKKTLFLIVLQAVCWLAIPLKAQDYSSIDLRFVYIAHEENTPIKKISDELTKMRQDALEVNSAAIVFLANGDKSMIAFVNLKDSKGQGRDTDDAFFAVKDALAEATSHSVNPRSDVKKIIQIFDEFNFVNTQGDIIFNSVDFEFYVGKNFWSQSFNELLIGHIYHDFKIETLPRDKFSINVFVPKADNISYPLGMPFGDNNVNNINKYIKVLKY